MMGAAVMLLNGIDPIGEPYLATTDPAVRDAWHAVLMRASRVMGSLSDG
jgi:hypothetical protein